MNSAVAVATTATNLIAIQRSVSTAATSFATAIASMTVNMMADLLDLMREGPRPVWRDGQAGAARPAMEGDLQWLADDYRDPRKGGKWFRYDARDSIWRCLDPFHQTGINKLPDQPPELDRHGRMAGEVAQ